MTDQIKGLLSRRFAALDGMSLEAGVAGEHPSGLGAAELARMLIEGTTRDGKQHSPPRDFMSVAADDMALIGPRILRQASRAVLQGKDPRSILSRGAEAAHETMTRAIDTFFDPPNAPATIAKKGRDDPLVNRGDFLDLVFGGYNYKGRSR